MSQAPEPGRGSTPSTSVIFPKVLVRFVPVPIAGPVPVRRKPVLPVVLLKRGSGGDASFAQPEVIPILVAQVTVPPRFEKLVEFPRKMLFVMVTDVPELTRIPSRDAVLLTTVLLMTTQLEQPSYTQTPR